MFVRILCLLKEYGFFKTLEQEEIFAFIKELYKICEEAEVDSEFKRSK